MLVAGDNFNMNKNNLRDVISTLPLNDLIEKIPEEGEINHFAQMKGVVGFQNQNFMQKIPYLFIQ
jgi:hypothetical protein